MAKLHVLPIFNSRMDQNLQIYRVRREVRINPWVFWKNFQTSLLFLHIYPCFSGETWCQNPFYFGLLDLSGVLSLRLHSNCSHKHGPFVFQISLPFFSSKDLILLYFVQVAWLVFHVHPPCCSSELTLQLHSQCLILLFILPFFHFTFSWNSGPALPDLLLLS